MTREPLNNFQGLNNVTKITNDEGAVSYLSQSVSFSEEAYAKGACKFNKVESEKRHVLFLFNAADAEVGRYYIGQKLQGKSLEELAELKHSLVIFKSWNPAANDGKGAWIPCVGYSTQENLAAKAIAF